MQETESFRKWQFASDNTAPMCPEALDALNRANGDWAPSYGDDSWTQQAKAQLVDFFERPLEVFFVFSGSAANALVLSHYCRPYHSVLCHPFGHIETDEACAPEFFMGGGKLTLVEGKDGKLDPSRLGPVFLRGHGIHSAKPRVLSITQSTEAGTVYSLEELEVLGQVARERELVFHMDGARFFNALDSLQCSPAAMTWKAGVDVLSLGATKNGGPLCEALVFFDPQGLEEMEWRRKMGGQLASKHRYLSAPFGALLEDTVWRRNARHANACARRLADGLTALSGVELAFPVQSNAVFLRMPETRAQKLLDKGWHFYPFCDVDAWRFMCSWITDTQAIDELVNDATEIWRELEGSAR